MEAAAAAATYAPQCPRGSHDRVNQRADIRADTCPTRFASAARHQAACRPRRDGAPAERRQAG